MSKWLPIVAQVLGSSAHDVHQIICHSAQALSVQFHSELAYDLIWQCLEGRKPKFEAEGFDISVMQATLGETQHARQVILNFVRQYCTV